MKLVLVSAKRTPFGAFGGSLKSWTATDLATAAAKAALEQGNVAPDCVQHVVFGNVLQTSADAAYLARHVALRAGLPEEVPAVTVNRLCGSGFEALAAAARLIATGEATTVLAGGAESMSQAPFVLRSARFGQRMGHGDVEDSLVSGLYDSYAKVPMGVTAENLARRYRLSREACDEVALRSQRRVSEALAAGRLAAEICPLVVRDAKAERRLETDEHPRPATTRETLAKLPPVFEKEGVVTAGNASGICDGAAALVMTTEDEARRRGWQVLAEWLGSTVVGCNPKEMGIGPVPATRALMARLGRKLDDFHFVEVNEAFAAQALAVEKELSLDPERLNVDGGAIALGHPLAASGSRLVAHLVYRLQSRGGGLGLATACIGGGQGQAVAIRV